MQDVKRAPKNLLALAVGIKQNVSVNAIIEKVAIHPLKDSCFEKWLISLGFILKNSVQKGLNVFSPKPVESIAFCS